MNPDRFPKYATDEVMGSLFESWRAMDHISRAFCVLDGKLCDYPAYAEAMTFQSANCASDGRRGRGVPSTLNVLEMAGFEGLDNSPMRMLRA